MLTLLIAGLFFSPEPSQFFDAKGVKIHYIDQGSGDPVVLIHGLGSSGEINWRLPGTFAAVAKNHRAIALDLPGHGRSDKPESEDAYGVQMSEDVILLLDHLGIKKAHIAGYSLGGMVALKLISKHQDRVETGILGGMGWLREGGGLQKVWDRIGAAKKTPPACVRSISKLAVSKEDLEAIHVPVTVLVGDQDVTSALYVAPLQGVRKDWPVVKISDANHFTCIVKPQFQQRLVNWVDSHPPK